MQKQNLENHLENQNHEANPVDVEPVARFVARLVSRDDVQRASLLLQVEKVDGETAANENWRTADWRGWRHFAVYFAKKYPGYTLFLPVAAGLYLMLLFKFFA